MTPTITAGTFTTPAFASTIKCTAPLPTYFCATDTANPSGAPVVVCAATAVVLTAATTVATGVTAPIGCTSGTYTATTPAAAWTACYSCGTGYWLSGTVCFATIANCVTATSSTVCTVAAAGYTLSSAGAVTACVAGSLCTSLNCGAATMYLSPNGTCVTGTLITGCWFQAN